MDKKAADAISTCMSDRRTNHPTLPASSSGTTKLTRHYCEITGALYRSVGVGYALYMIDIQLIEHMLLLMHA